MASLESIDRLLTAAARLMDEAASEIRDAEAEPVHENIEHIGRALSEIFQLQQHIYESRLELAPADLSEPSENPEANRLLGEFICRASELERSGNVQAAIAELERFTAQESSPFQVEIAVGEIERLRNAARRKPIFLAPGQGRAYPMGRIAAVFKSDESETESRYSVSEWWLEPRTQGPGAHSHAEDDLFYVIEGTMSVLIGKQWFEAPRGSFVLVPGGVTHDFENRGSVPAGVLNFSVPGAFESDMPGIVEWFAQNPPKDTGT